MADYLIVDDNEPFAENLAEILSDAGHRAVIAHSGAEALQKTRLVRFDALLSDMRMPAMSGAQLIHEIRSVDPGVPAVLVTAYSADEDLKTARQEGLLAVLAKPLVIPKLMELLGRARRDGMVVMVEDDPALADTLTEALRDHGFSTVLARSVIEADRLASLRPFAAVVDLRLPPGPNGEAMKQIAARFPDIPVIAITEHDLSSPVAPTKVLKNPFDAGALLEALEGFYRAR